MKQLLSLFLVILFLNVKAQQQRSEENFDKNWLFARYGLQANGTTIVEPEGLEQKDFNDLQWRKLDLPHDWGIEGPFRQDLDGYTGKLPWKGIGWYRKHFTISSSEKNRQLYVDFDGAMANAEIWLNGHKVGEHPYGYTSFRVELTPYVLYGKENVIAVKLNTEKLGSRWYPGAGIYRHVRLVKTNNLHVAHWGVFVTTPTVAADTSVANVEVKIENSSSQKTNVAYVTEIFELDSNDNPVKKVASSQKQTMLIESHQSGTQNVVVKVPRPLLWDLEHTNRYQARVLVYTKNNLTDDYRSSFGFRTIQFTHDNGFLLNGKRVQIQGTCNHHDLGALGAAINESALRRQLSILKQMGCNALRTSHNPPAPELLMLADKMGFLVMDEAFDCFQISKDNKNKNDYARWFDQWHENDLSSLILRDRNHPSVIMWSMGNEIPEQHLHDKFYLFAELRNIIHHYDSTRPATCGISLPKETAFSGVELNVDVHGMNYASGKAYGGADLYNRFINYKGHENLPGYGSETSSTMSSRGEYFPSKFQMSSYDLSEPGWGSLPDAEFEALDRYPAICGEFVWTGFDYLGEPTPFNSDNSVLLNHTGLSAEALQKEKERLEKIEQKRPPSRSSYFGIVDIAGFPKDRFYLYQARWRPDLPMVHILPHWNFPDRVGKITPVFVYTSGDEAELFLNGKSLGRKKKAPFEYRLRWDSVRYEPGELKAIAYKNGAEWSSSTVKTTDVASKLTAVADKSTVSANGEDLVFVTVSVTDKNGLVVPNAHNPIKCSLQGDGEIVATDNGDPTCLISFSNPARPAFNGLLLVVIKAKNKATGNLQLTVESEGLQKATTQIQIK
jgi:beta-galactosidase